MAMCGRRIASSVNITGHITCSSVKGPTAHELDDIRVSTDCPACGGDLIVLYKTLRLSRTIECLSCGETVRLIDGTPIGIVQRMIDEEGRKDPDDD